MKKFVWDIEKIREIQKSLDNSEIKKNSNLYEELKEVYKILLSSYKKNNYNDFQLDEYLPSNFKEYFLEEILPFINMEALLILEKIKPKIKNCKPFQQACYEAKIKFNNEELFEIISMFFKSIPNKELYNSFLELTDYKKGLINIQYVKDSNNCHGFCIVDSYNHIPYINVLRNNTALDLAALFHEIFHMIVRCNETPNHINSKSTIYDEVEGYFSNLLICDLAIQNGFENRYFDFITTNDLLSSILSLQYIDGTISFIKNIENNPNIDEFVNPYIGEDISTAFSYLCALDFYNLYKNDPEGTINNILKLASLKGENIQDELSNIGISFFDDNCTNLKNHYYKIKRMKN